MSIVNLSAYKFVSLADPHALRPRVASAATSRQLKGTVLLSPEGINLFVAGTRADADAFMGELRGISGLEDLQAKESLSATQPFGRMVVKVKREIIAFGIEGIDPARRPTPKLPPRMLKAWLDEGRPVTLLDTRNQYEVELGTFRGAAKLGLRRFREFPSAVRQLPPEMKHQPVVMFCTGGIRCEKAGPFLEREGFERVFQLEGGILKYFEECGGAHFEGTCFVFDERGGLDPDLRAAAGAASPVIPALCAATQ